MNVKKREKQESILYRSSGVFGGGGRGKGKGKFKIIHAGPVGGD